MEKMITKNNIDTRKEVIGGFNITAYIYRDEADVIVNGRLMPHLEITGVTSDKLNEILDKIFEDARELVEDDALSVQSLFLLNDNGYVRFID